MDVRLCDLFRLIHSAPYRSAARILFHFRLLQLDLFFDVFHLFDDKFFRNIELFLQFLLDAALRLGKAGAFVG